jgi:hypothetical protein
VALALWVGIATLTLTACGKRGPPAPPAVQVSTVTVKPQAATVAADYVAQTEAVNTVEVRPRVGGVLEKQLPIEGEHLRVGEVLFVIDQQPYIAAAQDFPPWREVGVDAVQSRCRGPSDRAARRRVINVAVDLEMLSFARWRVPPLPRCNGPHCYEKTHDADRRSCVPSRWVC